MINAELHVDKKSLSYTYENKSWSFTNYFEGKTRISEMESLSPLQETVSIEELRDGVYVIAWEDEEMGPITQLVDFPTQRILAAVPWEGKVEIWSTKITAFAERKFYDD